MIEGERMATDDRTRIGSGLLVMTGFGLGAAVGLLVRGGAQWGTVGEWIGGIGAFFAGLVALQLEAGNAAGARRREAERAAVSAARIAPRLTSVAERLEALQQAVDRAGQAERFETFCVLAAAPVLLAAIDRVLDLRSEFVNLPAGHAVVIEWLMTRLVSLRESFEFIATAEAATATDLDLHNAALRLAALVAEYARQLATRMENLADSIRAS